MQYYKLEFKITLPKSENDFFETWERKNCHLEKFYETVNKSKQDNNHGTLFLLLFSNIFYTDISVSFLFLSLGLLISYLIRKLREILFTFLEWRRFRCSLDHDSFFFQQFNGASEAMLIYTILRIPDCPL